MIIVYIPLTKCRDSLDFTVYDRKNISLNLICCHSFVFAFVFTEQNIKASLNRYIIKLEGSV